MSVVLSSCRRCLECKGMIRMSHSDISATIASDDSA